MKFLNQVENDNFYYKGDDIYNINKKECMMHKVDFNPFIGENLQAKIYTSGLLVSLKLIDIIDIYFIRNNGKELFRRTITDIHRMDNPYCEVNGIGCASGILISYTHRNGDVDYEYYTYTNKLFKSDDFYGLQENISAYEEQLGLYLDEINNKKKSR